MKRTICMLIALVANLTALSMQKISHHVVVIIPSYNNIAWYKKNIDMLIAQDAFHKNWHAIYIDDGSTDGTGDAVQEYVIQKGYEHKIKVIKNGTRRGALSNIYRVVIGCPDESIVVIYDGDDWFAHDFVLGRINYVYRNPQVWVTYGQHFVYPSGRIGQCEPFPAEVMASRSFRSYKWVSSAPRTFYAGLFKKIKREDLVYGDDFFKTAGDCAYMFPLLEMAAEHVCFIPDILYVYNCDSPLNDYKSVAREQALMSDYIRAKPIYERVETWKN